MRQKEHLWSKTFVPLYSPGLDGRIPSSECKQRGLLGAYNNVSIAVLAFQSHCQSDRVESVLCLVLQIALLLFEQHFINNLFCRNNIIRLCCVNIVENSNFSWFHTAIKSDPVNLLFGGALMEQFVPGMHWNNVKQNDKISF